MYKMEFYVPEAYLQVTTEALFGAGAGKIGDYDRCCWVTEGMGQFRPLTGSEPFSGREGTLSRVPELKVELVFTDQCKSAVIAALHAAHPYETPAYQVFPFES